MRSDEALRMIRQLAVSLSRCLGGLILETSDARYGHGPWLDQRKRRRMFRSHAARHRI